MNDPILKRFWFEFDNSENNISYGGSSGIGVTAYNYEDAISILSTEIFKQSLLPNIIRSIENVDISTLDADHVLPNMGPPNIRGVWYPKLYLY